MSTGKHERRALSTRQAQEGDAAVIAAIYSQGIADRIATFETEPRAAHQIATMLAAYAGTYPAIVVERDGVVTGCAWASPYRPRTCYAGIAEFSVYVDRAARAAGVGTLAVSALIEACEARGFWKLLSRIFPENTASRALCRRLGFREVGLYRRHARLDGVWRDVVIVERLLGDAARDAPLPAQK